VLTGGGACLPGIAGLAENVTHLPTRVGVPFGIDGVSDSLRSPAYATGVGLLAWELSQTGKQKEEVKKTVSVKALVDRFLQLFHR
jgi:cell division protein FtsA